MITPSATWEVDAGRALLRNINQDPTVGPNQFVDALEEVAFGTKSGSSRLVDSLSEAKTLPYFDWMVSQAYWHMLRRSKSPHRGIVFTPPGLARQALDYLTPGLPVVDLGAGTGLLTFAAARRKHHVTAIELEPTLVRILRALGRILKLDHRIEVHATSPPIAVY
jgi:2-polyprenyl-3-methyl-5-hydroxy-6-metoxy-1,4-benzoquinol methylase